MIGVERELAPLSSPILRVIGFVSRTFEVESIGTPLYILCTLPYGITDNRDHALFKIMFRTLLLALIALNVSQAYRRFLRLLLHQSHLTIEVAPI